VEKYKKGFLSAEALTSMGKIFESEGKDKQALDVYTRVVKEYPDIVTEYAKMRHDVLTERIKN
jgi:TolA-binding protein